MILGFVTGLLAWTRWTMVIGGIALLIASFTVRGPLPQCDGAPMHDGETCKVQGERFTAADVEHQEIDAVTGLRVMGGVALAAGAVWFLTLEPSGRVRRRRSA